MAILSTFTKDGVTKHAYTQVEVVQLRFEGWTEQPSDAPPPKGGEGSGREEWTEYAEQHGVPVDGDATRAEITDALTDEGVPTE